MFAHEERCLYKKSPLMEVICQLRFPVILKIDAQDPFEFQDAVRAEYPQYAKKTEQLPPKMENGRMVQQGTRANHQFVSSDGQWKISLTQDFIALSTHTYRRWEEFAKRLDFILAAFIRVYEPAALRRVGLRYINFISRRALELDDTPWRELIEPGYLGLMGDEDVRENAFSRHELQATVNVSGGAKANIKCGPAVVRKVLRNGQQSNPEQGFMLDLDLFMDGETPLKQAVPALNVVHLNAGSLFRGAITDTLHEALEPTEL